MSLRKKERGAGRQTGQQTVTKEKQTETKTWTERFKLVANS